MLDEDFFNLFDKYSIQNIEEGEFYTLIKGKITVYLSHYTKEFDMADVDNHEAIVSVFRDHHNILTVGGSLEGILKEVKKILKESNETN